MSQANRRRFPSPLFKRLIDEEPAAPTMTLSELKRSIKDNLEQLFNTHQVTADAPDDGALLLAYGVPDYSNLNTKSDKAIASLCRALERAASAFETRLIEVRIQPDAQGSNQRTLHLRVSAKLRPTPTRERVSFDTFLQLPDGKYELRLNTDKRETREG